MTELSHVNEKNQPGMVDISTKSATHRTASAQAIIALPPEITERFVDGELQTKKGPVFQTAIIAGTQGAKQTSQLIPFCHPLGLDACTIEIIFNNQQEVVITCTASVEHKTGVEMEALTGASVTALTVYDMCKALSHNIVIREVRLLNKSGGKSDFSQ